MQSIVELDKATESVVRCVYAAIPAIDWQQVVARMRIAPLGNVSSIQFTFRLADGRVSDEAQPLREAERLLDDATFEHWRITQDLGQPRWYMMTVKIERSGKYLVEFEYRTDYQEGDISKPLSDVQ
jgi:hypothetical protein